MMKKFIALFCGIVAGLHFLLALIPIALLFHWNSSNRKIEAALSDPGVYEPVAKTLALYSQSDPSMFPKTLDHAWLPEELDAIGPAWAYLYKDFAHVRLSGGRKGYELILDPKASTSETNVWNLHFVGEGPRDRKLLKTFQMEKARRLTPDELPVRIIDAYDREGSAKPGL
ncbi:MAG: hypothetical protein LAT83_22025 [Kiritimatiellae bacterium]|nr:hypothetical protein [Kiritimatiellia bacterium]